MDEVDEEVVTVIDKRSNSHWAKALVLVVLIIAIVFVAYKVLSTGEKATNAVAGGFKKCLAVAAEVLENEVNVRVVSVSSPSIDSSSMLIVADLNVVELFDASTASKGGSWKDDLKNLRGETFAEIRVAANYVYQVDLKGAWRLEVNESECNVVAPPLLAKLPVAFDTSSMEKKVDVGWARFNGDDVLEELEKGLTPRLNKKAESSENKALALDKAKLSIAEFVRDWFLQNSLWEDQKITTINVYFATSEDAVSDFTIERGSDPILSL